MLSPYLWRTLTRRSQYRGTSQTYQLVISPVTAVRIRSARVLNCSSLLDTRLPFDRTHPIRVDILGPLRHDFALAPPRCNDIYIPRKTRRPLVLKSVLGEVDTTVPSPIRRAQTGIIEINPTNLLAVSALMLRPFRVESVCAMD